MREERDVSTKTQHANHHKTHPNRDVYSARIHEIYLDRYIAHVFGRSNDRGSMGLTTRRKKTVKVEDGAKRIDVSHGDCIAKEAQFSGGLLGAEIYIFHFGVDYSTSGIWLGYAGWQRLAEAGDGLIYSQKFSSEGGRRNIYG
jgi:hypothetical protein